MYVKKDELRAAIVNRIQAVQAKDPERVKTSYELREEKNKLELELRDSYSTLLKELVLAQPDRITNARVDTWRGTSLTIDVDVPHDMREAFRAGQAKIQHMNVAIQAQLDREQADRRRYKDSGPTSLRELEAWLVRLDNDVKTATVNVRRPFAVELGLA